MCVCACVRACVRACVCVCVCVGREGRRRWGESTVISWLCIACTRQVSLFLLCKKNLGKTVYGTWLTAGFLAGRTMYWTCVARRTVYGTLLTAGCVAGRTMYCTCVARRTVYGTLLTAGCVAGRTMYGTLLTAGCVAGRTMYGTLLTAGCVAGRTMYGTLLTAGCLSNVFMKKQGCVFARVRRTAEFIASVCRKKKDYELKVSN